MSWFCRDNNNNNSNNNNNNNINDNNKVSNYFEDNKFARWG